MLTGHQTRQDTAINVNTVLQLVVDTRRHEGVYNDDEWGDENEEVIHS